MQSPSNEIEEQKKLIRPDSEESNMSEFELCREYSKTRSMEQE